MIVRALAAGLLAVLLAIVAIEVSSWMLGRAESAVIPAASVSDFDLRVPHAPEIDAPTPASAPALTW